MRYVQINSVPYGSTGTIMHLQHEERLAAGDEAWMMWGRGRSAASDDEFNYGSAQGWKVDALKVRLDGREGFHSKGPTRKLIAKLDEIDPDIVHLHNLHGYHVNVEMLFGWLAHRGQRTIWTLHDCWAFTGHCAHFINADCDQWMPENGGCASSAPCPQLGEYPATRAKGSCAANYEDKRRIFTSLPAEALTIWTPSRWLADLAGRSFLACYPIEVHPNPVDLAAFQPSPGNFKKDLGIDGTFTVLGVASPWTPHKGLHDFARLRNLLGNEVSIVMVGLDRKQIKSLPSGIIGLPRLDSREELAEMYSEADLLFQPSREESFGLTIAEAHACGTPSLVYSGGACAEVAGQFGGTIVADVGEAARAIAALADGRSSTEGSA